MLFAMSSRWTATKATSIKPGEARKQEHKLATRRYNPLSLISVHEDQERHKFNRDNVEILDQATTKPSREVLEVRLLKKFKAKSNGRP